MEFNLVFDRVHGYVLGHLRKLNKGTDLDSSVLEDIAMETMYKVHKNLEKIDETIGDMSTYACRIAKNAWIDRLRKRRLNTVSINVEIDDETNVTLQVPSNDCNPLESLMGSETGHKIVEAVKQLPQNLQELFEMRFIDGMKYHNISEELNMPLGSVKGNISRIRKVLQESLENSFVL